MAVAVGGSRLYGSTPEQACDALGIAGVTASMPFLGKFGWDIPRVSWLKDGNGPPAESGVRAAALAARGFRGPDDLLDGDAGYWAMVNSDRFDPQPLTDFSSAMIVDLRFKGYPACRLSHSALDALADILASNPLQPDDIKRITVRATTTMAANMAWPSPGSAIDAQFNTRFAMAALLARVPLPEWYAPTTLERSDLLVMMQRVEIEADPDLELQYRNAGSDPSYVPITVSVSVNDGRTLTAKGGWASGSPQRALSEAQLLEKFDSLVTPTLGSAKSKKLREIVMTLDRHKSLTEISALLVDDRRNAE
jgi:2-methylcitrate dehydratase PrpD